MAVASTLEEVGAALLGILLLGGDRVRVRRSRRSRDWSRDRAGAGRHLGEAARGDTGEHVPARESVSRRHPRDARPEDSTAGQD